MKIHQEELHRIDSEIEWLKQQLDHLMARQRRMWLKMWEDYKIENPEWEEE